MKRRFSAILAIFSVIGVPGSGQTLHIRLLNGITGQPIANTYVNVWVSKQRKEAIPITIDSNGNATLSLGNIGANKSVEAEPTDMQTFPYASGIRIQVGFVLCQIPRKKYSWLQITPYSTEEWAQKGIVTANSCGNAVSQPKLGQLIIFARPLTLWEKLSE